jgi:hypothetical protein
VFVLDALGPLDDAGLAEAGAALASALTALSPHATVASRVV